MPQSGLTAPKGDPPWRPMRTRRIAAVGVSLTLLFGFAALSGPRPDRESSRAPTAQKAAAHGRADSRNHAVVEGARHPADSHSHLDRYTQGALLPATSEAIRRRFAGESKERALSRASVAPVPLDLVNRTNTVS